MNCLERKGSDSSDTVSPRCSVSHVAVKSKEEESKEPGCNTGYYRTYRQRWAVLISLMLLIFSNSMARIAFGPVAYTSATFYETKVNTINWFAIVYMVVGIPVGLVVTWVINRIGLRKSLLIAAWLNCVGAILRLCSALDGVDHTWRLVLVFAGHVMSAVAQPVFMFTPTKVAAVWFADDQRALANTLATSSNPLGILAANIFSPLLVKSPSDILTMLIVYVCPPALGALLTTFFVRSDTPPDPPSASANSNSEPFWIGIKKLARNRYYWVLFLSIGGGVGIYTAITVFLEQILCPWGYPDFFSGVVCGTCLVLGGVFGAVIAGLVADRTKHFSSIAKVCYTFCALAVLLFSLMHNRQNQHAWIAVGCALIGFFGLPLLPLGNELIVESTYPVESATSTGIVFLSGQLQGMILILVLQELATPLSAEQIEHAKCLLNPDDHDPRTIRNMTTSCFVLLGYTCVICLCFVIFFKNTYRRLNMERRSTRNRGVLSAEDAESRKTDTPASSDSESTSHSYQHIVAQNNKITRKAPRETLEPKT